MSLYEFTSDWFSHNVPSWQNALQRAKVMPARILEVGCYEGRSTVWMMENIAAPGAELVSIDLWEEGSEADQQSMDTVEARFDTNIKIALSKRSDITHKKIKGRSHACLSRLLADGHQDYFDLTYVDGSHFAPAVLTDAVLCFHLTRIGGVMFFDDYLGALDRPLNDAPKLAIDSFFACFHGKLGVIPESLYQFYVQKLSD